MANNNQTLGLWDQWEAFLDETAKKARASVEKEKAKARQNRSQR